MDVQKRQRMTVLAGASSRCLPTTRTYASDAALSLGVRVERPERRRRAQASTQQRLTVHGAAAVENTIAVDGMKMNTLVGDGDTTPITTRG